MEKDEFKLTDLDYLIGDHHLQMIKAALPYMQISQQRFLSLLVKGNELIRTAELFREGGEGEMGICSVGQVIQIHRLSQVESDILSRYW